MVRPGCQPYQLRRERHVSSVSLMTMNAILVVLDNGEFYITNFDPNNHYEDNILRLEKWDEHKIWTADSL